jgi:hypothetical protein
VHSRSCPDTLTIASDGGGIRGGTVGGGLCFVVLARDCALAGGVILPQLTAIRANVLPEH